MKIGDWIVYMVTLAAVSASLIFSGRWGGEGESVEVYQDRRIVYTLSLNKDRSVSVYGPLGHTTVVVEGGKVRISDSPCPHKTCVRTGKIHRPGSVVVCVPNRVLVRVRGSSEDGLDGVTQ
jgi:hypothetical protein